MKTLVVLDYGMSMVHFYNVVTDVEINDEYIKKLGFNLDQVSYICGDLEVFKHKGILI